MYNKNIYQKTEKQMIKKFKDLLQFDSNMYAN